MQSRQIKSIIPAVVTADGAGVVLRRSLGQHSASRCDPFLMLDEFSSDRPEEYIGGFPAHPHRGFETVTYMLEGHMLHEDHMGNQGHLRSGDVQWMTAGKGIIHSEMPQQEQGLLRGFQLWINLPAKEKMKPASYRDIPASVIPVLEYPNALRIKIIAGSITEVYLKDYSEPTTRQAIYGPIQGLSTDPIYLDILLTADKSFTLPLPEKHQAFIYVYEGEVKVGEKASVTLVNRHQAGILSEGNAITVQATHNGARFLLIAGKPLHEPIVQRGPFVMNTWKEIEQAMYDYQHGQLA